MSSDVVLSEIVKFQQVIFEKSSDFLINFVLLDTTYSIYQNPALVEAARTAVFTSWRVLSKLL
jgi:hypothetical protein